MPRHDKLSKSVKNKRAANRAASRKAERANRVMREIAAERQARVAAARGMPTPARSRKKSRRAPSRAAIINDLISNEPAINTGVLSNLNSNTPANAPSLPWIDEMVPDNTPFLEHHVQEPSVAENLVLPPVSNHGVNRQPRAPLFSPLRRMRENLPTNPRARRLGIEPNVNNNMNGGRRSSMKKRK